MYDSCDPNAIVCGDQPPSDCYTDPTLPGCGDPPPVDCSVDPSQPECAPPPPSYSVDPTGGRTQRRGVSVEEVITTMRALNDHEPWYLGRPEFFLLVAGKQGDGQSYSKRVNIPEGMWSREDPLNAHWRSTGTPISLILHDRDLGTRMAFKCLEGDAGGSTTTTVKGSTKFGSTTLEISQSFTISSGDDNCGESYLELKNSNNEWYYIPDGQDNDGYESIIPFFNGTSDLQWYGYGLQRL